MTEDQLTDVFVELYMGALKSVTGNPHLKSPTFGGEKWKQLEAARKLVDEMKGDYADFINCSFKACQHVHVVCKPHHLCSTKAVERYLRFQRMKNKYNRQTYSVDGDYLIVNATGKRYPLKQVDLGTKDDPEANYASYITSNDIKIEEKDRQKAIEGLEYLICKIRYKESIPTEAMLRKLKELNEDRGK